MAAMKQMYGEGFLDLRPTVPSSEVTKFQKDFSSKMGKVGKAAGAALAAAMAAAVAAGSAAVMAAISQDATADRLAASMGLSEADQERMGSAAGSAYMAGFGESVEAAQGAAAEVMRRFGSDISDEALGAITEGALTLADVFDEDVTGAINAAQQLLVNGLAPDAEAAMDVVATAMQNTKGPVDEVIEAINEYSAFYGLLGLDAANVLGGLTSEWGTNQYAIDKAGDAIKEFSIRVIDDSASSNAAIEALGLQVEDVHAAFAEGGPAAADMSTQIIESILAIEDPAARASAGVALMGAPFEDLGANAGPILQDIIDGVDDYGGATERIADQAYNNVSTRLSSAWRTVSQTVVEQVGGALMPTIEKISKWVEEKLPGIIDAFAEWLPGAVAAAAEFFNNVLRPAFEAVSSAVSGLIDWWQNLSPESQKLIIDLVLAAGAAVVAAVAVGKIVAAFKAVMVAFKALSALMALNPWVLLIAAVVALVVLIVRNWDTIVEYLAKAWQWIKDAAGAVWDWVKDTAIKAGELIANWFKSWPLVGFIIEHWDTIKEAAGLLADFITDTWDGVVDFFRQLPSKIASAVKGLWDGIKESFRSAINWIIRKWNDFEITIGGGSFMGVDIPSVTIRTPNLPLFHDGGMVPGRNGEDVLAVLQAGERVLSRAQVAAGEDGAPGGMPSHVSIIDADGVFRGMMRVEAGRVVQGRVSPLSAGRAAW